MRYFLLLVLSLTTLSLEAEEFQRSIHVSGVGQVRVVPDMARLTVNVFKVAKETAEAKNHVNDVINDLLAAAKSVGIKKRDMNASSFQIRPEYEYGKNDVRDFVGMYLERSVTITLRDLDKLSELVDAVIEAEVDYFSPPALDYSKREQAEAEALRKAIANARLKAEVLADEENDDLGRVLEVREQGNNHTPRFAALSDAMPAESIRTEVLPGTLDIISRVQVSFSLQD